MSRPKLMFVDRRADDRMAAVASGLALIVLVATIIAACATPSASHPHGEADQGRPLLPNLFISPAGKPYRATPGAPYPVTTWFAAADTNHDGQLSLDEFIADAMRFFDEVDTDHDGVIEGAEVANYEQTIAPEILPKIMGLHNGEGMDPNLDLGDARNTGRDADRRTGRRMAPDQAAPARISGEPSQGAALFSMFNEPEPVAAADSGFDGRITRAEFRAAAERRFHELDVKSRGYLLLSELPRTPVQEAIQKSERRSRR